jgi:hypothetical protein
MMDWQLSSLWPVIDAMRGIEQPASARRVIAVWWNRCSVDRTFGLHLLLPAGFPQMGRRAQMRIVNPSFGREAPSTEQVAATVVDWRQDPIVLFSNSKPNAKELLEGVRDRMGTFRATDNIDYVQKDTSAQPAPSAMVDELATRYRAALLAIAD